jgi:hypothetical protein
MFNYLLKSSAAVMERVLAPPASFARRADDQLMVPNRILVPPTGTDTDKQSLELLQVCKRLDPSGVLGLNKARRLLLFSTLRM